MEIQSTSPFKPVRPSDLDNPVQPGPLGHGKFKPIPANQDMAAIFSAGSEGGGPSLPPPTQPQRTDLARAAALLDELMILFHQMSGEARKVNAQASWQQMHLAKDQNLKAADLKQDAAGTMRVLGFVSMGVGIAGAGLTVAGPVVALGTGLLTAGGSAAAEAAKETGKEVTKEVVKEVTSKMTQKIADEVAKKVLQEVTEEGAKKAAEEAAKEVAKEVSKEVTEKVAQAVAKEVSGKVNKEIAKEVGREIGREIAKEVGQEVAQKMAQAVTSQAGDKLSAPLTAELTKQIGDNVTKEITKTVAKEAGQAVAKAIGQSTVSAVAAQVFTNPHTVKLFTDTTGQTSQSLGQAQVQTTQAEGDRMGAEAQATMGQKQRSDQFLDDFRELMKKMNQLISDLLAAKNQSEAAAAKA